jgi:hypothetical protein
LRNIDAYATAFEKNTPIDKYSTDIITANTPVDYHYRWHKLIFVRDEYNFIKWFHPRVKRMLTNLIKFMERDEDRYKDTVYHEQLAGVQKYYEELAAKKKKHN